MDTGNAAEVAEDLARHEALEAADEPAVFTLGRIDAVSGDVK